MQVLDFCQPMQQLTDLFGKGSDAKAQRLLAASLWVTPRHDLAGAMECLKVWVERSRYLHRDETIVQNLLEALPTLPPPQIFEKHKRPAHFATPCAWSVASATSARVIEWCCCSEWIAASIHGICYNRSESLTDSTRHLKISSAEDNQVSGWVG